MILPLAQPQLAERLGLVPPRAIVLFGPPGTGKTSFARGAASRLGWPFVELFPSRLAGESPAGLAAALREAFALVAELDKVVLFIDEVEEIAGSRRPRTVSAAQGVTNEMLKLIPAFREQEERLLICATNSVRALDSAFLRHGRFDYVLPIGPPGSRPRGRRSGIATWLTFRTTNWTWTRSSPNRGCSPRPTSNSPPAAPRSWPSSASCSSTAIKRRQHLCARRHDLSRQPPGRPDRRAPEPRRPRHYKHPRGRPDAKPGSAPLRHHRRRR